MNTNIAQPRTETSRASLAKPDQILEGLRTLSARQRPGECFSAQQVASACGVHKRSIQYIEQRALLKVTQRLASNRGLLSEIFSGAKVNEVFAGIVRDPYARPSRRKAEKEVAS